MGQIELVARGPNCRGRFNTRTISPTKIWLITSPAVAGGARSAKAVTMIQGQGQCLVSPLPTTPRTAASIPSR